MRLEGAKDGLLHLGLNQDHSCFSCGTERGVRIYNCDPLKQLQSHDFQKGVGHVEMLFRCCYLALVGGGSNPAWEEGSVVVWEDQIHQPVCTITLNQPVLGVRLKRDRIVVITERELMVYTLQRSPTLILCYSSAPNPRGLAELCPTSSLLCFPSVDKGQVSLVNVGEDTLQHQMRMIPAHDGAIRALSLNMQGTMLATASEKGTLIRVFDIATCLLLYELRRGTNKALIYCISFSRRSNYLAVTSDSKTLHVFSLEGKREARSVSKFALPTSLPALCCFGAEEKTVLVVGQSGFYTKLRWNEQGEMHREEQLKFLLINDD